MNRKTINPASIIMVLLTVFIFISHAEAVDYKVNKITVEGLRSIDKQVFLYLFDLKEGGITNSASIQRGIKRVFRKGIFEDVIVETYDNGEIMIKAVERDFLDTIEVEGNNHVSKKVLLAEIPLKEGGVMREDLLEESIEAMRLLYKDRGFPLAEVKAEINKESGGARLKFSVKEGNPLLVQKINIFGIERGEVEGQIPFGKGDIYNQNELRRHLEKITSRFKKEGYLSPVAGPYSYKDGELEISFSKGKRLVVSFENNDYIREKTLMSVLPFKEAEDFSEELIEEAVSKIIQLYRSKGHALVKIAPVFNEAEGTVYLKFFVSEGEKIKLGTVGFTGNSIDGERLKEVMGLEEGESYNPDSVESDINSIREFYIALGYINVSIEKPKITIKGSFAYLDIAINEGRKVTIKGVEISGFKTFGRDELYRLVDIKSADPYNELDIADARYRIIDLYSGNGFVDCKVDVEREIKEDAVMVYFSINEGSQVFIGKTIFSGARDTKEYVLKRELSYKDGDPLNLRRLHGSRQGLYRLGLFAAVNVEVLEKYEGKADISVNVEEGNAGMVEVGAGYGEYELYRGFLDVNYMNLFGTNKQLGLRTEFSSLESRYIINYTDPWLLGDHLPLRAFILRENRREKNIDTGDIIYKLERNSVSVGTEKRLMRNVKGDIYYEYSIVNTYDVMPDVILSKEDTGTLAISSLRPGIIFDTRDNAFDPKSGVFSGMTLKAASSALMSETDFLKLIVHGSSYYSITKWLVSVLSVRGGIAKCSGDTKSLPLIERFFLGGRTTVRGFNQDSIGPKSAYGTPVGGDSFLLGNIELRAHVAAGWSLVGFLDAGNVWQETEKIDTAGLRYSTGAGLRFNTPVGPIRFDYGYKLNRQYGESRYEIHFSIGHAF